MKVIEKLMTENQKKQVYYYLSKQQLIEKSKEL
jgi:rRNA processing protein Krr1/Pno1